MVKFYAVKVGKVPGIYYTWDEAKKQVLGFQHAKYKSFQTLQEAEAFLTSNNYQDRLYDQELKDSLIAYTDGSGKNGVGGYGIVVINQNQLIQKYYGKVQGVSTNNIAEFYAIAVLLNNTTGPLTIYTDSDYARKSLTVWIHKWIQNGWNKENGQPVKNKELIQKIYELMENREIKMIHVKAHANNKYNEIADKLAEKGRLVDDYLIHIEE